MPDQDFLGLCPNNFISGGKVLRRSPRKVYNRSADALHRLVRCFHSPLIHRMNPGRSSSRFYRIRKSRQMSLRVHQ
jgi:hypothetical protein